MPDEGAEGVRKGHEKIKRRLKRRKTREEGG